MVHRHFEESVVSPHLAEGEIEPEVVQNMRSWQPCGFSLDQSVLLPANDRKETERLVHCMTRRPFSLSRLGQEANAGQVVYKADRLSCRAFPA